MLNRRNFLKNTILTAAATSAPGFLNSISASEVQTKITILHTNDVHSHIEPFEANHPNYPGRGGVARRAAIINKIRSQEKNVLLFDAGDIFQGTPYFNFYNGEPEIKLMSKMGYDAGIIGNHEFDTGIDNLSKQISKAEFPIISSNYDFSETPMKNRTIPYKIFHKNGIKIGLIGLGIELDGLVGKELYGETAYNDPAGVANHYARMLKQENKCDLVVCLSHLGYKYNSNKISDTKIAQNSSDIDLIIGGHTHTFLDKPSIIKNKNNKDVIINQVGWAGLILGRIDIYFDEDKKKTAISNNQSV